jgi:hypothetical protein
MDTSMAVLGERLGFDPGQRRGRCFGHIINLACNQIIHGMEPEAFEAESDQDLSRLTRAQLEWNKNGPVSKLHNIVHWIHRSGQRNLRFRKLQLLYKRTDNDSDCHDDEYVEEEDQLDLHDGDKDEESNHNDSDLSLPSSPPSISCPAKLQSHFMSSAAQIRKQTLNVILNNSTQWNSTYLMIKRAVREEIKQAIRHMLNEEKTEWEAYYRK